MSGDYRLGCGHYNDRDGCSECDGGPDVLRLGMLPSTEISDEYRRTKNRKDIRNKQAGSADGFYLVWWMIRA